MQSEAPPTAGPQPSPSLGPTPTRASCAYAACYCEENVYLLARSLLASSSLGPDVELFAVFVSNHSKTVPLWRQRAAPSTDRPVVWDYHVFLLARCTGSGQVLVLDLDCTLDPFPCTLEEYRRHALLGSRGGLAPQFQRCYRVVPAPLFLDHFASDRSHMRCGDGGWQQPPPPWPPIVGPAAARAGAAHALPAYLSFPPADQLHDARPGGAGEVATDGSPGWQPPTQQQEREREREQEQQQEQQGQGWLGRVLEERAFLAAFGAG